LAAVGDGAGATAMGSNSGSSAAVTGGVGMHARRSIEMGPAFEWHITMAIYTGEGRIEMRPGPGSLADTI
jgi:hypothetical protein